MKGDNLTHLIFSKPNPKISHLVLNPKLFPSPPPLLPLLYLLASHILILLLYPQQFPFQQIC